MADLLPENDLPVSSEDEETALQVLDFLKEDYGVTLSPIKPVELERLGFQLLPENAWGRISGALQQVPGLVNERLLQDTYQKAYAGAYRLVLPPDFPKDLEMMPRTGMDPSGKIGSTIFRDKQTKKFAAQAGLDKIDPPDVQAQQIAHLAFSAASVATQQYFLYRIDQKLESIQKTTENILEFLELDKQSRLQARCHTLEQIRNSLQSLLDSSHQRDRDMELINLKRIREEALSDLLFYQKYAQKICEDISAKRIKSEKQYQEALQDSASAMSSYWLALYYYELAVMYQLILNGESDKEKIANEHEELIARNNEYTECYNQYRHMLNTIVESVCNTEVNKERLFSSFKASIIAARESPLVALLAVPATCAFHYALAHKEYERKLVQDTLKQKKTLNDIIEGWNLKSLNSIADGLNTLEQLQSGPIELALSGEKVYLKLPERQALSDDGPDVELRMRETVMSSISSLIMRKGNSMKHTKLLLLALCLALAACGPKETVPEGSSAAGASSVPDVSQSEPDVDVSDASQPEAPPVTEPSVPFTEEELDQARQAALDYYAGTVFDVTELVFEEQMENTVSFTVKCSKGGVPVDPDRAISLERQDGAWTVVSEGY